MARSADFDVKDWSIPNDSFRKMKKNTPIDTKANGESRRWTYRTEIRSHIDILIHNFTIIINGVNSDPTVERSVSFFA